MNYALLIYENKDTYAEGETGEAWKAIIEAHTRYGQELEAAGVMRGGAGLNSAETATTVRTTGGRQSIHDGPFADAREELGGFYLIETADLDAAMAWARKMPLGGDGAVEVRPVLDM